MVTRPVPNYFGQCCYSRWHHIVEQMIDLSFLFHQLTSSLFNNRLQVVRLLSPVFNNNLKLKKKYVQLFIFSILLLKSRSSSSFTSYLFFLFPLSSLRYFSTSFPCQYLGYLLISYFLLLRLHSSFHFLFSSSSLSSFSLIFLFLSCFCSSFIFICLSTNSISRLFVYFSIFISMLSIKL